MSSGVAASRMRVIIISTEASSSFERPCDTLRCHRRVWDRAHDQPRLRLGLACSAASQQLPPAAAEPLKLLEFHWVGKDDGPCQSGSHHRDRFVGSTQLYRNPKSREHHAKSQAVDNFQGVCICCVHYLRGFAVAVRVFNRAESATIHVGLPRKGSDVERTAASRASLAIAYRRVSFIVMAFSAPKLFLLIDLAPLHTDGVAGACGAWNG